MFELVIEYKIDDNYVVEQSIYDENLDALYFFLKEKENEPLFLRYKIFNVGLEPDDKTEMTFINYDERIHDRLEAQRASDEMFMRAEALRAEAELHAAEAWWDSLAKE